MREKIIIATRKLWHRNSFKKLQKAYPHFQFILIQNQHNLNLSLLDSLKPRYLFFPHWSFLIPKEIYQSFECIVFHMSDLPFGRGGSPLQNLIMRGIKQTKISALRVSDVLDGGDIYLKTPLDISKGSAKQIYKKASKIIFLEMIPYLLNHSCVPKAQSGEVINFKRRKKEQSNLESLENPNLQQIYDFIRMLDAPSYPKAFLDFREFRIEFRAIRLKKKQLIGRFRICKKS